MKISLMPRVTIRNIKNEIIDIDAAMKDLHRHNLVDVHVEELKDIFKRMRDILIEHESLIL